MENKIKQVWLNMNTGEFSNSWDKPNEISHLHNFLLEGRQNAKESGWKLIEYTCLNDDEFKFYNQMKLK